MHRRTAPHRTALPPPPASPASLSIRTAAATTATPVRAPLVVPAFPAPASVSASASSSGTLVRLGLEHDGPQAHQLLVAVLGERHPVAVVFLLESFRRKGTNAKINRI